MTPIDTIMTPLYTPDSYNSDRPEPFASVELAFNPESHGTCDTTIIELTDRYGIDAVLDAISDDAQFTAENEDTPLYDRLLAGRRYLELSQLCERMVHFEETLDAAIMPEAEVTEEVQG